ncbi:leucine-rich repeat domain-containing protein [Candidatus Cytomitobacter primus]|uniref:Leucine-rich repeat domain-containing protein n=1 Tax=Candidatus Cytomitobacter primus TaxID=2066024 RepID=A0A5C0UGW1_9PROT|nr:leucine-rich repeat domain-containing protein [Candidatus Cytomitobacter primus]QEK38783.1 leucine-rich repeat domain-containing protein [Candidatus Cytomitobacter primus]
MVNGNSIGNLYVVRGCTKVVLNDIKLTGNKLSILDKIISINELRYLDLVNCALTKALPNIFTLQLLECLSLSNNNLSEIVIAKKTLPCLRKLDLSRNNLSKFSCRFLRQIEDLDLSRNKISDLKYIKNMKNLVSLNIANNNIDQLDDIGDLVNIEILNFVNNRISKLPCLDALQKLRGYYARNNRFACIEETFKPIHNIICRKVPIGVIYNPDTMRYVVKYGYHHTMNDALYYLPYEMHICGGDGKEYDAIEKVSHTDDDKISKFKKEYRVGIPNYNSKHRMQIHGNVDKGIYDFISHYVTVDCVYCEVSSTNRPPSNYEDNFQNMQRCACYGY